MNSTPLPTLSGAVNPGTGRSSVVARIARVRTQPGRGLVLLAVVSLIAAFTGGRADAETTKKRAAGTASGEINKVAIDNFDPATWKPTQEMPLPAMESPITFNLKDQPSYWFDTELENLEEVLHTRSLGVGVGATTVNFNISEENTESAHTVTSMVWPEGAQNMPYNQAGARTGQLSLELVTPGLYVFQCVVHPYMLGAVVLDDPATPGADLGKTVRWLDHNTMATSADEIMRTVRSFFVITEPANWQRYARSDTTWDPEYPAAPVLTWNQDGTPNLIPNLDAHFQERFGEPVTLKAPVPPKESGVGTIYYGAQWEMGGGKTKPGSLTVFDAETWKMTAKWFVPSVDWNNPHNFWFDNAGKEIYSTNWFANNITVLDRETGKVLREFTVGPSPSHVVTRSNTGELVSPNNGGGRIIVTDPGVTKVDRTYMTQERGQKPAFPHGHWVSGDGRWVITPNSFDDTVSIFDLENGTMRKFEADAHPVATSITNDGKRGYNANLWSHTMDCISIQEPACPTPSGQVVDRYKIDWREHYDPITGESDGPFGLVPIQTPISPDDEYMLTVGTVTANVVVTDMDTNQIVKTLPACPGVHGINFGAKKGGGYYGYVTNKFCNKMIVVDGDPNGDGNPADATIVGEVLTDLEPGAKTDADPVKYFGQGGNGIMIYPIVYNGWVQKMPDAWKAQLTCKQREPITVALC
jgi:YVTN family beta-propeller protein